MLSSFIRPRQETTITAFWNYLTSEVEALEDKGCETSKQHLKQGKGKEPSAPTLSRCSSATSTFVPQTIEQPQQPAPATREYIYAIQETQMPASQVIEPA